MASSTVVADHAARPGTAGETSGRPVRLVLVGRAGAGKDTAAAYLAARYGFARYAFADRIKRLAAELFPEAYGASPKPRALLQEVGTALRRVDPGVWVRYLLRRVEAEGRPRAVITDCRYRNELEACLERGFVPVAVECPAELRLARLLLRDGDAQAGTLGHESEAGVDLPPGTLVLDNSGTVEDLHRQIDALMEGLGVNSAPPPDARPGWHETFMKVALVVAERSTCLRKKVGAVLVRDRRVIATGYNGAPRGLKHCAELGCLRAGEPTGAGLADRCRAVHAEENCVVQAAVFGVPTVGAELYTTAFPCAHCAKTLVNAGVDAVHYLEGYPDPLAAEVLREAGVEVRQVVLG